MPRALNRLPLLLPAVALLLTGCSTTGAKKAMNKPQAHDAYSGFDRDKVNPSKREEETPKTVAADSDPEKAVDDLVLYLRKNKRAYTASAEEQLKYWGLREGVDQIVVRKVRPLLKDESVEVRAPALRLTVLYGREDSNGDLIECLGDPEYGIRETAFKALRTRTRRDFGYDPTSGEIGRTESMDQWRKWWQETRKGVAVQPPSVFEREGTKPAPGKNDGKKPKKSDKKDKPE